VSTLTKSLFTWKTAGILTGMKLATLAGRKNVMGVSGEIQGNIYSA